MTGDVRRLKPSDSDAFMALRLAGLASDPLAFSSTYDEEVVAGPALAAKRLKDKTAYNFGAFIDGKLAGIVTLLIRTSASSRHTADLVGMYVDPAHRGQGVADNLVNALFEQAKSLPHLKKVMLNVVAGNDRAHAFYVRHGFQVFGAESQAAYLEGRFHDEVMMVRFLKP
jgi:GNAT superfamily N-acetyltransferase